MFGFSKKADINEYSNDVRNILRNEFEWTTDKFVRFAPHLDHLTKLGRKGRINPLATACCAEHTAIVLRMVEIGKNNPDEELASEWKTLREHLTGGHMERMEKNESRLTYEDNRFIIRLIEQLNNS
jgi:hypothetical protein